MGAPSIFWAMWLILYFQFDIAKYVNKDIFAVIAPVIFPLLLLSLLLSIVSLFFLPRFIKKSIEDKKLFYAILIGLFAISPVIIVLNGQITNPL